MPLRRICLALASIAACGDEPAALPCGEAGLQPLTSPGTVEEARYNLVLERLQGQLHAAVGKYVDGSRPAYFGVVRALMETNSPTYGHRRTESFGLAYGVLIDDTQPLDSPEDFTRVPVHTLQFFMPKDRTRGRLGQDPRPPGSTFHGGGSVVIACQGDATPFQGAPATIVLTDVVCAHEDTHGAVRYEFDGSFEKLDPAEIDYTILRHLRDIGDRGHFPALDHDDVPADGVLLETVEGGRMTYNVDGPCYDEVEYSAQSFIHTECLATHGVAALAVGPAQRCCCEGHCHPGEYLCKPLASM